MLFHLFLECILEQSFSGAFTELVKVSRGFTRGKHANVRMFINEWQAIVCILADIQFPLYKVWETITSV